MLREHEENRTNHRVVGLEVVKERFLGEVLELIVELLDPDLLL